MEINHPAFGDPPYGNTPKWIADFTENPNLKWMMTGGSLISENLHIFIAIHPFQIGIFPEIYQAFWDSPRESSSCLLLFLLGHQVPFGSPLGPRTHQLLSPLREQRRPGAKRPGAMDQHVWSDALYLKQLRLGAKHTSKIDVLVFILNYEFLWSFWMALSDYNDLYIYQTTSVW